MSNALSFSVLFVVAAMTLSTRAASAQSAEVQVRTESSQTATLHAEDGHALCEAPCETTLSLGTQRLGLTVDGSELLLAEPVAIPGPGTLHLEHHNHQGLRKTGWTLLATLGVLGVAAIGAGAGFAATGDFLGVFGGLTLMGVGALHVVLALALGLPMGLAGDGASIRFEGL